MSAQKAQDKQVDLTSLTAHFQDNNSEKGIFNAAASYYFDAPSKTIPELGGGQLMAKPDLSSSSTGQLQYTGSWPSGAKTLAERIIVFIFNHIDNSQIQASCCLNWQTKATLSYLIAFENRFISSMPVAVWRIATMYPSFLTMIKAFIFRE